MTEGEPAAEQFPLYAIRAADPRGEMVAPDEVPTDDLAQIDEVMSAMGHLRTVERRLAEASQEFMKLNETDMRALHYLMIAENQDQPVTASALARYLRITTASTTKLIDRLERQHHVVRHRHPSDRRALLITVSATTRTAAIASMGRHQASRVKVAAELSPEQRAVVIDFLNDTATALQESLDRPPEG
ncbi:MAG TPA: MarR family transcriptional regulator [Candidatus Avipropionibacterium avicola]|uniref:MarR family transcriptional regulator n=1 Tax=Candidatus Avipropionibacterium avicola TaxID=2840701 RepID=A0A9D1KM75_9ACTN|nr:MarR family transcriptional regulator [Candidatus Avipropionibacterium avicola]